MFGLHSPSDRAPPPARPGWDGWAFYPHWYGEGGIRTLGAELPAAQQISNLPLSTAQPPLLGSQVFIVAHLFSAVTSKLKNFFSALLWPFLPLRRWAGPESGPESRLCGLG